MTLDEIETKLNSDERGLAKGIWAHAYGPLLIRAVRQLGTVKVAAQLCAVKFGAGGAEIQIAVYGLDPDVLALLEEA